MILSPLQNSGLLLGGQWLQKRPVVTQGFGENPQIYKQFGLKGHNGIDFRSAENTSLFAPFEGLVHEVGDQGGKGYGKFIRLRKDNLEVILGHLNEILVKKGDIVQLGKEIALSGNTGFSTGPHLHFGARWLKDGVILNADNGYSGYFDQSEYILTWKGSLINNL